MSSSRAPIGVRDSGLGGLSVLKALREELPNEQFLYCADCAHTPWGDKPESFIVERTRAIVHFLLEKRAKAIVLACNTATAAAADILRRELSVPIIGIEPAVKPAAAHTRTGVIGVIATRRTTESARYLSLLKRFAGNVKVVTVAAPGLMECVERGDFNSETTRELLLKYLTPIKAAGADKLVLGCTHYPFLSEAISEIMGPEAELLEPGKPVALVTRARLRSLGLLNDEDAASCAYFVAGAKEHQATLKLLLPGSETIAELPV